MNRTQFHRQLSALYDTGNRQAIATRKIAKTLRRNDQNSYPPIPTTLSNSAFEVICTTSHTIFGLKEYNYITASAIAKLNEYLAASQAQLLTRFRNVLESSSPNNVSLEDLFKAAFEPIPSPTPDISNTVHSRVLMLLEFELEVARHVLDPVVSSTPPEQPLVSAPDPIRSQTKAARRPAK